MEVGEACGCVRMEDAPMVEVEAVGACREAAEA
jgi:hypothetical protein